MSTVANKFLPMTREEMNKRGWKTLDILLITGDAYFDHPSHGAAVIGRVLESAGFKTGIIARPDWKNPSVLKIMGTPSLFVGITAGAVDSTLNNYTADLAPRKNDQYAPADDKYGRPNYATVVYTGAAKAAFSKVPVIIGGIEASTRRFAYYDYLKKYIRRSILLDTRAAAVVFGPGETQIVQIAKRLSKGLNLDNIPGTALLKKEISPSVVSKFKELPPFETVKNNPQYLLSQTSLLEIELGPEKKTGFYQKYQEGFVVCEPPALPDSDELDAIYNINYLRKAHPVYKKPIPALETVKWSVTAQRGCPGGCSFCAISMHQGRKIVSRSKESILSEIKNISRHPDFKGTITDIGGPTANAYGLTIKNREKCKRCKRSSCFYPKICSNINDGQPLYLKLLTSARGLKKIKHLFVASGIRHDLALRYPPFIDALAKYYTGGHLKVAPEHTDAATLKLMRKPAITILKDFERIFIKSSKKAGKKQFLVPYFISGFPGCTMDAGNSAGNWLRKRNQKLEQVQNFIPLPGTMAAAMYAAKMDINHNKLYIPDAKERKRQKNLLLGSVKKTFKTNRIKKRKKYVQTKQ